MIIEKRYEHFFLRLFHKNYYRYYIIIGQITLNFLYL